MSKVLTFIDWYTPAYKAGGPIRSVRNIVEAIGDHHEFYVVTGSSDFTETETLKDISTGAWTKKGKAQVIYLLPEERNEEKFQMLFQEISPDYIYLNSLFSPTFTLRALRAFKNEKEKIVLAPRGMLGKESLKIKSTKKKIFLGISKLVNLYKGITWHVTNNIEKDLVVEKFGSNTKIKVAPNMPFITSEEPVFIEKKKGELILISVSRIVPIKNILFLLKALVQVKSKVKLIIVGPNEDEGYWGQCENVISAFPENISIEYVGQVIPDDIGLYYKAGHVYISPTLNENYGHSIVEALGYGQPVIISDKTPWKKLKEKGVGFDLILKEEIFSEKIEYYANMDQEEFNALQQTVRRFALTELINDELLQKSINLFKD